MCSGGEGGGGQGGGGKTGAGVGHIGAGIILSGSCLPLTLFCFMFEVKSLGFYCFNSWSRIWATSSGRHILKTNVKRLDVDIAKFCLFELEQT